MALVSPGVQVTVIDESNYAPLSIGSVAYILLATAQDKFAPGGVSYAAGTLQQNAEKLYTITSQRDLVTTFGNPIFKTTAAGTPINGDEQNEYGLLAAYSLLGVSNQVYVQRANVNLGDLNGTTSRPTSKVPNNSYWLDLTDTNWGIEEWNLTTQSFTAKNVLAITDSDYLVSNVPATTFGSIGDYAVNTLDGHNRIFKKMYDNSWQVVGSQNWQKRVPVVTGTVNSGLTTISDNIKINGTNIALTSGSNLTVVASAITAQAGTTGVTANIGSSGYISLYVNTSVASNANLYASSTNVSDLFEEIGFAVTSGDAEYFYAANLHIGTYSSTPSWQGAYVAGNINARPSGSVYNKVSALGDGLNAVIKRYSSSTNAWVNQVANDYANLFVATYNLDPTGGGYNVLPGTVFTQYNADNNNTVSNYLWHRKNAQSTLVAVGDDTTPTFTNINGNTFVVKTRANIRSSAVSSFTVTISANSAAGIINGVSAANIPYVSVSLADTGALQFIHSEGGDIVITDTDNALTNQGITSDGVNIYDDPSGNGDYILTNWAPIVNADYYASVGTPSDAPVDNTLWYYSTPSRADILINNGSAWVGYRTLSSDIRGYDLTNTNPAGPIVSASEPTAQSDDTALVYGDLWLDTSDLENYPVIRRYQNVNGVPTWVQINNTDATSTNGIIFADARWAADGNTNPATDPIPTITELSTSSYLDIDAPDATIYPRGMLLWNTRASGYNVKRYRTNYFNAASFPEDTLPNETAAWVSVAGYQTTATPNFGRKAPRGVVVAALKSAIDSSEAIKEDNNFFNLIACPGYPELIPNMVTLNNNKDNTAFVIGDTPFRLPANGTDIAAWANNSNNALSTGEEGLITTSPYLGIYYPSGQTTDLSGSSVVVPPSHAVLRAMIKNDTVGYPWLAPAGTRRGLIDNLSSIGYIDENSGRFVSVGINQGLRDTLYVAKINPLTVLPGTGLLIYGQKTLSSTPSSLDRINVARLVNYLRSQLNIVVRPYLFEPNDPITRNSVTAVVSSLLNDIVAKRGITDYLVVCDTTNNTPQRIANNQLWVDVAIQPTKDVEFIYIPIRLKNPGEIQDGNIASASAVGTGA